MKYEIEFTVYRKEIVEIEPEEIRIDGVKATITEKETREIPHFRGQNIVCVEVPEGFLEQYTSRIIDLILDLNGEIEGIDIDLDINTTKIVSDWKNAGYPLNWR